MSASWVEIEIEGRVQRILAQKIKGTLWFNFLGKTYSYKPENKRHSSGASKSADPTKVYSPMPGRITKVNIKKGDTVSPGQCLVVMEAMKMEYSLSAEVSGEVDEVLCALADTVTQGDLIVSLRELNE